MNKAKALGGQRHRGDKKVTRGRFSCLLFCVKEGDKGTVLSSPFFLTIFSKYVIVYMVIINA